MPGRNFLPVARGCAAGPSEYYWRAGVIHADYALVLECRDAQLRWGFSLPPRDNMHARVRLRFAYAKDADLQTISKSLDKLVRWRNKASYDLSSMKDYTTPTVAHVAVQEAADALALLDQVDGDPVRRAVAVAAITP